jgi:hypothetical protein
MSLVTEQHSMGNPRAVLIPFRRAAAIGLMACTTNWSS